MAAGTAAAFPARPGWSPGGGGEVDQSSQVALNNRQIDEGYIILCVARPRTDCTLEVGVESHDRLYRNPFADPLAPHELKPDIAIPRER